MDISRRSLLLGTAATCALVASGASVVRACEPEAARTNLLLQSYRCQLEQSGDGYVLSAWLRYPGEEWRLVSKHMSDAQGRLLLAEAPDQPTRYIQTMG